MPVERVDVVRRGHHADLLRDLDARRLTETEGRGIARDRGDARPASDVIEEIVARHLDGLGHVDAPVRAAVLVVEPAFVGPVAVVIHALRQNGGLRRDDAGLQRRDGRHRLEGRAGRVGALRRAVPERLERIGVVLRVILVEGLEREGRV